MKQILHFLDEADFQNFTAQLFSEELPLFQAIEGAGGDGGLDGIDGEVAYQMYFPEEKNRNKKKYIEKINDSLAKLGVTIKKHDLVITRWIFVVPEDLHYEVILHLKKTSGDYGIECIYWGATKLTALVNKYPYIKNAFPGIFLTDLKVDLERVSDGVAELSWRTSSSSTDILKDDDYNAEVKRINSQMQAEMRSINARFGNTSVPQAALKALQSKYQPLLAELHRRKQASDEMYDLELREVNLQFDELVEKKSSEHLGRGTYHSGVRLNDIQKIEERRSIELKKLRVKYGKMEAHKGEENSVANFVLNLAYPQFLALKVLACMNSSKVLTISKRLGGELISTRGCTDKALLKEFESINPQEMIANLDELESMDILNSSLTPKGNAVYKPTAAGYRIIQENQELLCS